MGKLVLTFAEQKKVPSPQGGSLFLAYHSGKHLRLPSDTLDSLLRLRTVKSHKGGEAMPLRPKNRKELLEIIESIEAGGGDATALRRELEALEPEAKRVPQTRRNSRFREEEETVEERLTRRVGDLFPNGITDELLARLFDIDKNHSLKELRAMCKEAGLSLSGDKHELAAKLVAKGIL